MKDSVVALIEALRLARLELHCFRDPRCAATPEWTIQRLETLLLDPVVGKAMQIAAPDAESPPIVPEQSQAQEFAENHAP
jgi:hypothetical protein